MLSTVTYTCVSYKNKIHIQKIENYMYKLEISSFKQSIHIKALKLDFIGELDMPHYGGTLLGLKLFFT